MNHRLVSDREVRNFLEQHNARSLRTQLPELPETFTYALDNTLKNRSHYRESFYSEIPDIALFVGRVNVHGDGAILHAYACEGMLRTLAFDYVGTVHYFCIDGGFRHVAARQYRGEPKKYFTATPELLFSAPQELFSKEIEKKKVS